MEQNTELEGVMRRVQKLLAIASDARANPAEAAAAASQAEKIMRKFQLEHADVLARDLRGPTADVTMAHVFANMKRDDPKRTPLKKSPPWGQMLAVAIAKLHDCQVRQGFAPNKFGVLSASLVFQGYRPDVEVCAWTFDYIVGQLIAAVAAFNKNNARGLYGKTDSASYRLGFTSSVTNAIHDLKAEKARDNLALSNASRALVLVDAKKAAIEAHFGEAKYVDKKSNARHSEGAYREGQRDGAKVDVGRRALEGEEAGPARLK